MIVCIPIEAELGLNSPLCMQFARAPKFIVVDTETRVLQVFDNPGAGLDAEADACLTIARRVGVESVVVGGIGMTALSRLQAGGVAVFTSGGETVGEIVTAFSAGDVHPVTLGAACRKGGRGFSGFGCGGGCCE